MSYNFVFSKLIISISLGASPVKKQVTKSYSQLGDILETSSPINNLSRSSNALPHAGSHSHTSSIFCTTLPENIPSFDLNPAEQIRNHYFDQHSIDGNLLLKFDYGFVLIWRGVYEYCKRDLAEDRDEQIFDCSSSEDDYHGNSEHEIDDTDVIAEVHKQLEYFNTVKNNFQKFFFRCLCTHTSSKQTNR